MRFNYKKLKRITKNPVIRPRVTKDLRAFDQEINGHRNGELTKPHKELRTSNTIGVLRYLIKHMDTQHYFQVSQRNVMARLNLNQISYNFNFAALHQLKYIRVDWHYFKLHQAAQGIVNTYKVF